MQRKRAAMAITATAAIVGLASFASDHRPSANIAIEMHRADDLSPHRIKAGLDLGLMAVNVLYSWTATR